MCAVKVVEGSGALCSALRLPGRGYRLVMPQRVCGRDRPVLHLVLPAWSWKASLPGRAGSRAPPLAPPAWGWEVRARGCVGISLFRGFFGTKAVCPVTLRDPESCSHLLRGWRTHAFQQLWVPEAGPGTLRSVLYTSVSCSPLRNVG